MKKTSISSLIILSFIFISQLVFSKNYYTSQSGNWSVKNNWTNSTKPSFTISSGDSVFIKHNIEFPSNLTVYGIIIIDSAASLKSNGSKSIELKNGGYVYVNGNITCEDLNICDGGTLSALGSLKISGDFTNDGDFIIETNSNHTGSLIINGNKNETKITKFNRMVSANGWHYVTSPERNSNSNDFSGGALYSYNENLASWKLLSKNEKMVAAKGYDVYFDSVSKIITFHGPFNDSSQGINLTYTSGKGYGYNMVGNPYPSAIDWDASNGWTKTNVNNAIYTWDDATQNVATYINGVGTNGGSNIIAPTMAFFVVCNNSSGGYLGMTNDVRVTDIQKFRKNTKNEDLMLTLKGQGCSDQLAFKFQQESTNLFDTKYDAEKFFNINPQVPQIFSISEDKKYLNIDTRNILESTQIIPIYYSIGKDGSYSIILNTNNLDVYTNIILEDLVTGTFTDLRISDYSFEANVKSEFHRFNLHLIPLSSLDQNLENNMVSIPENERIETQLINTENGFVISSKEPYDLEVYDLNGKSILFKTNISEKFKEYNLNIAKGTYVIKTNINGEYQSFKYLKH